MPNSGTASRTARVSATVVESDPVGERKPGTTASRLAEAMNRNRLPARLMTWRTAVLVTPRICSSIHSTSTSSPLRQRPGELLASRLRVASQLMPTSTPITIQVLTMVALSGRPASSTTTSSGVNSTAFPPPCLQKLFFPAGPAHGQTAHQQKGQHEPRQGPQWVGPAAHPPDRQQQQAGPQAKAGQQHPPGPGRAQRPPQPPGQAGKKQQTGGQAPDQAGQQRLQSGLTHRPAPSSAAGRAAGAASAVPLGPPSPRPPRPPAPCLPASAPGARKSSGGPPGSATGPPVLPIPRAAPPTSPPRQRRSGPAGGCPRDGPDGGPCARRAGGWPPRNRGPRVSWSGLPQFTEVAHDAQLQPGQGGAGLALFLVHVDKGGRHRLRQAVQRLPRHAAMHGDVDPIAPLDQQAVVDAEEALTVDALDHQHRGHQRGDKIGVVGKHPKTAMFGHGLQSSGAALPQQASGQAQTDLHQLPGRHAAAPAPDRAPIM